MNIIRYCLFLHNMCMFLTFYASLIERKIDQKIETSNMSQAKKLLFWLFLYFLQKIYSIYFLNQITSMLKYILFSFPFVNKENWIIERNYKSRWVFCIFIQRNRLKNPWHCFVYVTCVHDKYLPIYFTFSLIFYIVLVHLIEGHKSRHKYSYN